MQRKNYLDCAEVGEVHFLPAQWFLYTFSNYYEYYEYLANLSLGINKYIFPKKFHRNLNEIDITLKCFFVSVQKHATIYLKSD